MIPNAIQDLKRAGLLGMNRRNAEYIMQVNPRSSYPKVDDKVLTKRLSQEHRIPTPPLYHVLHHHGDLSGLKSTLRNLHEFVVKPARGTGGSGILLIVDRAAHGFLQSTGESISHEDLTYHIGSILSGIYSLEGLEDKALIEALIHPHPVFDPITYRGVSDIRIIVYRGVPVMSMVRLPTKASDGKANLHRGAIAAGISISTGVTLTAVHRSRIITRHPDTDHPVDGIQVPYWKQMLRMAAQSFEMTGLGYIGVDLIIDREQGPLLLEMNARPGLAIQLANVAGLRGRLEMVDRTAPEVFNDVEDRVIWAMETFTAP